MFSGNSPGVYGLAQLRIRALRPGEDGVEDDEEIVTGLDDLSYAGAWPVDCPLRRKPAMRAAD
jgi:hypothetical protein